MRSARRYYRFHLAVAALGALALVASGWVLVKSVNGSPLTAGELLRTCRNFADSASPGSLLVLALFVLTLVTTVRGSRSATRQLVASRRFVKRGRTLDEISVEGIRVRLLDDERPHAFCAGLLRPRVYLSTRARAVLSQAELRAVVLHEAHHARQRDPLRLLIAQVASEALFFLPMMRRARQRYADLAEIAADEAAVTTTGGPGPLAAAMLRFDQHATAGAVGIAPERVEHLLGRRPRWEVSASLLAGAVLSLAAVVALTYATAAATPAGGLSLSMLAMQACGVAMVAAPILAAVWIVSTARRAASRGASQIPRQIPR